ncbi:MAG TPA: alpha/beta hydrolase [Streptosporangiaceae bacterium]|nr:alpha/beta hydrolase [Streptosporangiaceae bacterium]
MHKPTIGTLPVPGASLYYEVRGTGPALLVIPTGNGDATPLAPMADALADRYTVITYDRRGFSRSPLYGPVDDRQRLEADVHDARLLLDHFSQTPAHVLGTCSGAIVALALLERHPGQIQTLLAHEPPLTSVLPDAARWTEFHAGLYDTYRRSGVEAARDIFKVSMGLDGQTRPPKGAELPPEELAGLLDRLRRNQVFWFEYEMRTYPDFLPDIETLKSVSDRLVLLGGSASREHVPYRPNTVLASLLGTDVLDFPGGHLGYVTHPIEFADQLAGVLLARNG